MIKPLMLYGVPNDRMKVALREELEQIGLGDEEIRKVLLNYPLVDLLHTVNQIIQKPQAEQLEAMEQWLQGGYVSPSKVLAREALSEIKGVLNAGKAQTDRSARTGKPS